MISTVIEDHNSHVEEDGQTEHSLEERETEHPLEDIINSVGFGQWTLLYFLIAIFGTIAELNNLLIAVFSAPSLQFWCAASALDYGDGSDLVTVGRSECEVEKVSTNGTHSIVPCSRFVYNTSMFTTTVTAEFDLVCSRSWYRELFQMLFTLGCVVGAPLGGLFCDMYGRQRAVFVGSVLMAACTLVLSFASSAWAVFTARFLLGIFSHLTFSPAITLGMEVCPSSLRTLYGTVESVPYAIVLPLLATIAYFCRVWRHLQLYSSIPLFLMLLLSCPLLMDESPRWLVSRGMLQEAEKVIYRAARLNRTHHRLPKDLRHRLQEAYLEEQPNESSRAKLWSLVSTPEMRKITFVTMTLWFCEGVLYLTLPLETDNYKSPFLYMALLGLLEIPASFIMVPIGARCGRIRTSAVSATITGALLAAMTVLRAYQYGQEWVLLAVAVAAYMTLVGVSQMLILLTSELFPTTVRGVGTSLGLFMANATYNLPPLFNALVPPSMPWVPLAINSVLAFLSATLVLTLPETNNRPLMQNVDQHVSYCRQHVSYCRQHDDSTRNESHSESSETEAGLVGTGYNDVSCTEPLLNAQS